MCGEIDTLQLLPHGNAAYFRRKLKTDCFSEEKHSSAKAILGGEMVSTGIAEAG